MHAKMSFLVASVVVVSPLASARATGVAVQLRGSHASMERQHEVATDLSLTFLRTPAQVRQFVDKDRLEEVTGNVDYVMAGVSFPFARPAVKSFIERLAAQYHAFSGEQLVVTSLTRPTSQQPRNASPLSVHPAGIAVDFRIPGSSRDREWLERTLLSLEREGVLDATREHRPPHYHVAVFPERYETYAAAHPVDTPVPVIAATVQDAPALSATVVAPVQSGKNDLPALAAGISVLSLAGIAGAIARRARKTRGVPTS